MSATIQDASGNENQFLFIIESNTQQDYENLENYSFDDILHKINEITPEGWHVEDGIELVRTINLSTSEYPVVYYH